MWVDVMGCLGEIQDGDGNRISTPSTPPAQHWLNECDIPVTMAALSICSRKVPDSAALREQNDSDQCSGCRCAPGQPHNPECDVSGSPDVSCDRKDDATGCDGTAKLTDSVTCADERHTKSPVDAPNDNPFPEVLYSMMAEAHNRHDDEPLVTAESCPECGAVTDIEYGQEAGQKLDAGEETPLQNPVKTADKTLDTLDHTLDTDVDKWLISDDNKGLGVPFGVQSWLFEALIESEIDHLHEIIDDHHDEIVAMARRRHREGHVLHGSKGYQWDAKTRLRNVLEELADGGTYLTMGSVE